MNLDELAAGCRNYSRRYDRSYHQLLCSTDGSQDPANVTHCRALLSWLRDWGCRQFELAYGQEDPLKLLSSYGSWRSELPSPATHIWELSEDQAVAASKAYWALRRLKASKKTFGPVGAAKTLFAIRPRSLMPWHSAIRKHFDLTESHGSYARLLGQTREDLRSLERSCRDRGLALSDVPRELGREPFTVPKLIDEYCFAIAHGKFP